MFFYIGFILSGVIAAMALLLPAMLLLHFFMIRSLRRTAVCTLFALYLGAVGAVVHLPFVFKMSFLPRLYLIPIVGMREDFINSVLNVILFIPLGVFLPMLYDSFKNLKNVALYGFLMSLTIEVLQLFGSGITDVNDLITNTCGAVLGYFLWKALPRGKDIPMPKAKGGEAAIVSIAAFVAVTTVQPALRDEVLMSLFY